MSGRRKGYALLAALWVTVALSAMALMGLLVARDVVSGAHNRIALVRGKWRAEDCIERARSAINDAMSGSAGGGWRALDRIVATSPAVTAIACDVTLVPAGRAVDINAVDREQLLTLLHAIGFGEPRADSMTDAVLDWRDADDIPRPMGAEAEWYCARGRFVPRNGPFAHVDELRRVRGFEDVPDSILGAVFTVEPGRIVWSRAPLAVLASLPGMSEEAVARIAEQRSRGVGGTDINTLTNALSPGARQLLTARYADLTRLTTDQPDAWILTSRGGGYAIELRLAPAGTRAAIVRRWSTP